MKKFLRFMSQWQVIIGIQLGLTLLFGYFVFSINVLPFRFFILFVFVLLIALLLTTLMAIPGRVTSIRGTSIRCILGKVLSVLVSLCLIFGSVFMQYTTNFLKRITTSKQIVTYSMIVLENSEYQTIKDLEKLKIGLNPNMDKDILKKVEKAVKEEITYKKTKYYNFEDLTNALFDKSVKALLVNEAYREVFESYHNNFDDDTRVIWSIDIEVEQETAADNMEFDVTKDSFTVCISGVDSRGSVKATSRSDVNMLVTVNPETHQILLTSIPRDYYVKLFSEDAKDKLTHSGLAGTANTVKTLENLFDTDIEFYARVNFVALVKLVDALGGIDVYSDMDLTSWGIKMTKGVNHIDGKTALAFSRERHAYSTGDRHRAQNQQDVLVAILKKMMSPSLLRNYTKVLSTIEDCFITNMSNSYLASLVNKQLNDNPSWQFYKQTLEGTGKMMTGGYYMPNSTLYYMLPNKDSVKEAKKKIEKVINGDYLEN